MDSDEEDALLRGAPPPTYLKRRKTTTKVVEDEYELAQPCDIPDDPGIGMRTKGAWYVTKKKGAVKWLGHTWSCCHGRLPRECRPCGGSAFCEHNRLKKQCQECGGSRICTHGKRIAYCQECGGSQICKHGITKSICRLCDGSRICVHNRDKRACPTCSPDSSAFCAASGCTTLATYPDQDGKQNVFCNRHASEAGVCSEWTGNRSATSCRFFCALALETNNRLKFEHECIRTGRWQGREVRGLVEGRHANLRPDGVMRDPADNKVLCVAEYHGNAYHGYPPNHPRYNGDVTNRNNHTSSAKALYEKTVAKMDAFVEAGYGVCYVWEHEHKLALREGVPLEDILHWHT